MTALRQRMLEDLQIRHYSKTTIRLYLHAVSVFAQHFGKPPDQLGAEDIRLYQLFLVRDKQVSLSTFIQVVCALRFLYTHTLNQKIAIERIPFPRRERKLPLILSREEVKALLQASRNLRHRTLLAVLYGSGLRVAEAAHLKVSDIDTPRNILWVRLGKGSKDRQTLLSPKLLELLRGYLNWSSLVVPNRSSSQRGRISFSGGERWTLHRWVPGLFGCSLRSRRTWAAMRQKRGNGAHVVKTRTKSSPNSLRRRKSSRKSRRGQRANCPTVNGEGTRRSDSTTNSSVQWWSIDSA